MRTTVPVSRFDVTLLPAWVKVQKHLNCGQQHDLHFVVPQSVAEACHAAAAELDGHFLSTHVHVMDLDPAGGWPYAPNVFFYHCAVFMAQDNPNVPFLINELDCLPLRTNSYDALASHYMNSGKPFWGNVGPTPWRDDQTGKVVSSPYGKGDVMMSGCGVYPGNLMLRPNFVEKNSSGLMADFMKGQDSTDEAWDIHLRSAMIHDGMGHTDLIASMWNTVGYRIEEGGIVCDPNPNHEIFQNRPGWEARDCGGKVHPSATLVHGCKDFSLADLILSGQIPEVVIQKRVSEPKANPSRVDELENQLAQMQAMMKQLLEQKTAPVTQTAPATLNPSGFINASTKVLKPSPVISGPLTPDLVASLIPDNGKKVRLDQLCKDLQAKPEQIKEIISSHPERFLPISGPAAWVGKQALVTA